VDKPGWPGFLCRGPARVAVARAGGARVPYAGVQHYGWPARGITAHPFLTQAVQATRSRTFAELDDGIGDLLKKHHLK